MGGASPRFWKELDYARVVSDVHVMEGLQGGNVYLLASG
jgi:hypothetical protein